MKSGEDRLSNLTKEQKALLAQIVHTYQSGITSEFRVVRHHSGSSLGYDGPPGFSIQLSAGDGDFYQLERESLIILYRDSQGMLRGSPTQRGITAIEEPSLPTHKADAPAAVTDIVGEGERSVNGRIFRKQGQFWTICFEEKTIIVKNSKGIAYIAHLLQNPRRLVLAADLFTAAAGVEGTIVIGSAGTVLDATALATYRARAEDLRERLSEAERNNDQGTKAAVSEELEQVANEMIAAKGLGGRSRQSNDDREKFRKAVSMAIVRSIETIRKDHPALADHLHRYIERGHFVIYSSDLTWRF